MYFYIFYDSITYFHIAIQIYPINGANTAKHLLNLTSDPNARINTNTTNATGVVKNIVPIITTVILIDSGGGICTIFNNSVFHNIF